MLSARASVRAWRARFGEIPRPRGPTVAAPPGAKRPQDPAVLFDRYLSRQASDRHFVMHLADAATIPGTRPVATFSPVRVGASRARYRHPRRGAHTPAGWPPES